MLGKRDFIETAKRALVVVALLAAILMLLCILFFILIGFTLIADPKHAEIRGISIGMTAAISLLTLPVFFGIYRATNYLKKSEIKTSLKPNINTQYIIYNHSIPHRVIFPIQTASFALIFSPFFIINYKYQNTNVNLFIFLPIFIAYMIIALFLYHQIIKYSKNLFRKKFKDHAEIWTNEEGIVFKEFGLLPWRNIMRFTRRSFRGNDFVLVHGSNLPENFKRYRFPFTESIVIGLGKAVEEPKVILEALQAEHARHQPSASA